MHSRPCVCVCGPSICLPVDCRGRTSSGDGEVADEGGWLSHGCISRKAKVSQRALTPPCCHRCNGDPKPPCLQTLSIHSVERFVPGMLVPSKDENLWRWNRHIFRETAGFFSWTFLDFFSLYSFSWETADYINIILMVWCKFPIPGVLAVGIYVVK